MIEGWRKTHQFISRDYFGSIVTYGEIISETVDLYTSVTIREASGSTAAGLPGGTIVGIGLIILPLFRVTELGDRVSGAEEVIRLAVVLLWRQSCAYCVGNMNFNIEKIMIKTRKKHRIFDY